MSYSSVHKSIKIKVVNDVMISVLQIVTLAWQLFIKKAAVNQMFLTVYYTVPSVNANIPESQCVQLSRFAVPLFPCGLRVSSCINGIGHVSENKSTGFLGCSL